MKSVLLLIININIFLLIQLSIFSSVTSIKIEIISNQYYPDERDALIQLRDSLSSNADLHSKWTGPPCNKNDSRWVGVACSNGHVVHVVLEGIELKGTLPPTFLDNITFLTKLSFKNNTISGPLPNLTNLIHLELIFLSRNTFWGPIPLEYTQLPKLKTLELQENYLYGQIPPLDQSTLKDFNVSYNHLDGPIPNTTVLQRFPKSCYDHNSGLCGNPLENPCEFTPPPPPTAVSPTPSTQQDKNKKKSLQPWSIALIGGSAALVPFLVALGFLCYSRVLHTKNTKKDLHAENRMSSPKSRSDPERGVDLEFFHKEMPIFDLDDLLRASAEVLGKGTLGTSYKTTLETGQSLAVKRLKDMNDLSKKEFVQQMQLLGKTRHENLVQIVSFYYSKDEKLVIYEFVPGGSLFELLHENRGVGRVPLNWGTRLSIIKDIAKGLTFLHQSLPRHKVPHANLKSSNVLITQNSNDNLNMICSKLTHFGFFPLVISSWKPSGDDPKLKLKLAAAKSPEYAAQGQEKKLSHKSDVYCFGILILEIITGRIPGKISPATGHTTTGEVEEDLSDWVRAVVNTDWSTDILDVEIVASREGHDEMLLLTELALECTDVLLERRPKMTQVLEKIEEIESKHRDDTTDVQL